MKQILALLLTALTVNAAAAADGSLFSDREFNVLAFGSWVDKDDNDPAFGAGVNYFFLRYVGVGASTRWDNYDGAFFDNILGEAYGRYPLERIPLAPYAIVSVGYSFETEESFWAAGGGAEWRLNQKLGIFSDVQWQMNAHTDDGVAIRAGVRIGF